ncbi:hypothetical protein D3C85_1611690 [compost metagenome]
MNVLAHLTRSSGREPEFLENKTLIFIYGRCTRRFRGIRRGRCFDFIRYIRPSARPDYL